LENEWPQWLVLIDAAAMGVVLGFNFADVDCCTAVEVIADYCMILLYNDLVQEGRGGKQQLFIASHSSP
jgi:hypothetical protein